MVLSEDQSLVMMNISARVLTIFERIAGKFRTLQGSPMSEKNSEETNGQSVLPGQLVRISLVHDVAGKTRLSIDTRICTVLARKMARSKRTR